MAHDDGTTIRSHPPAPADGNLQNGRLVFGPRDTLVVKAGARLPQESVERIAAVVRTKTGADKVLVLDSGLDLQVLGPSAWRDFESAPRNGKGFLAYGRHAQDSGRRSGYVAGDHWWAIIQFDIWRRPNQFVFAKDGQPIAEWGEATHWQPLEPPSSAVTADSPAGAS